MEIPHEVLLDKVRGGLLGQIIGNLNGIPHEFKYNDEPGNVTGYIPALPDGAYTDDDTDIEWVYVYNMQKYNKLFQGNSSAKPLAWSVRLCRNLLPG